MRFESALRFIVPQSAEFFFQFANSALRSDASSLLTFLRGAFMLYSFSFAVPTLFCLESGRSFEFSLCWLHRSGFKIDDFQFLIVNG